MSQSFFVGDYFLHSIFFENQFIFILLYWPSFIDLNTVVWFLKAFT